MEATADQRRQFGDEVRRLREDNGWSARVLAELLLATVRPKVPGFKCSTSKVTGWERGDYAPKQRVVVECLETVLGAEGRLLPLLGFPADVHYLADGDRVALLEARFTRLEEEVGQIRTLLAGLRPPGE